jgi:hypothetical protein
MEGISKYGWPTRPSAGLIWVSDQIQTNLNAQPFMGNRMTPGDCEVGDQVNLERAMGAHVRFGGHFVQVRFLSTAHEYSFKGLLISGSCGYNRDHSHESFGRRFFAFLVPTS